MNFVSKHDIFPLLKFYFIIVKKSISIPDGRKSIAAYPWVRSSGFGEIVLISFSNRGSFIVDFRMFIFEIHGLIFEIADHMARFILIVSKPWLSGGEYACIRIDYWDPLVGF